MKRLFLRRLAMSSMLCMAIAGKAGPATADAVNPAAVAPTQAKESSTRTCKWVLRGHPPKKFVCRSASREQKTHEQRHARKAGRHGPRS